MACRIGTEHHYSSAAQRDEGRRDQPSAPPTQAPPSATLSRVTRHGRTSRLSGCGMRRRWTSPNRRAASESSR
ncbi:hypothetical protein Salmuc_00026 [Salipiger mucosus DSM 16094]|uniref:Uncharacterized protein n=1 Tax=Salipiger mucosus DSM 16094 TaxID=1123237 RepID=S9R540_9RHOB|nr:hypothetical protein Salmuc_00026 [Salipiger mucosus DSM 16094]